MQRKRKISGFHFLLALVYGLVPSAKQTIESMLAMLSIPISRQAIDKKFNKNGVAFLKSCIELLLSSILANASQESITTAGFRRVLIADSTIWAVHRRLKRWFPGFGDSAARAACKLQMVIEAVSGKILHFDYHRATSPDQGYGKKFLKLLQPFDLILFDLGYYCIDVFKKIADSKAFFICPIYYHASIKQLSSNNKTSMSTYLSKSGNKFLDCDFMIGSRRPVALRITAIKNSSEKISRLRRKIIEDYRTKGRKPTQQRLKFCDWTTLITNIPASKMTAQQIINTYSTRWQIEIFFRDAKSHLKLKVCCTSKKARFEMQVLATLFIAALLFFIQGRYHFNNHQQSELSLEKLIKRFSQYAFKLYDVFIHPKQNSLQLLLRCIIRNSIKFHQPSRQTPRQTMIKCGL